MKIIIKVKDLLNQGVWDVYCEDMKIDPYGIIIGVIDRNEEIIITEEQAVKYGFIKSTWE